MAKKKTESRQKERPVSDAYIENAGVVIDQQIVETIETNYMPYVMSVIVSRAIPEIDGFKPSHRKLLYTMYKMGLLGDTRTKSANVVGQTMKLNPHGDAAIYETMVRMARGNESLLYPFVDSKGNFGKAYSRDMAYAASRYTEVKLEKICEELFRDIDKDTVDFVDNYDNTLKEPTLLPVTFPSILVNFNMGIAVGMASNICSFNFDDICRASIELIRDPDADISKIVEAPDFPGGGFILYNADEMKKVIETGRGSIKIRSKYVYDKTNNCIEVVEIPPTTTVEAIMDKIVDLVKQGKIREISDVRDETDLSGLKLAIDIKRGTDPDKLMAKLFKMTPLEDSFGCNFNVLIAGSPKVMGVKELICEWIAFREECVRRKVYFERTKKKERLHLLKGLKKLLLDIDKAIKIIRETKEEVEVIPNLMVGFGIDEVQAEYIAEIKLRHLNREYILKRTDEMDNLKADIARLDEMLSDRSKVLDAIAEELKSISEKYSKPRRSVILYDTQEPELEEDEPIPDYSVNVFFTRDGYFKKVTSLSLRMSGEHKLKDGDEIVFAEEVKNSTELIFFTDHQQAYKSCVADFNETKISLLGDFIPAKLGMDPDEKIVKMVALNEYKGHVLFFFENGKVAKITADAYETKTKRKKLVGAFSDSSPLVSAFYAPSDAEFLIKATNGKALLFNSAAISAKTTKNSQGVAVMQIKKGIVAEVRPFTEDMLNNPHRFRSKTLPAAGAIVRDDDISVQLSL